MAGMCWAFWCELALLCGGHDMAVIGDVIMLEGVCIYQSSGSKGMQRLPAHRDLLRRRGIHLCVGKCCSASPTWVQQFNTCLHRAGCPSSVWLLCSARCWLSTPWTSYI